MKPPAPEQSRSGAINKEYDMNYGNMTFVQQLLTRLAGSPIALIQALLKMLEHADTTIDAINEDLERIAADNDELRKEYAAMLDENSRLFEQGAEVSRDLAHSEAQYAALLDQKHELEKRLHGYDLDMRGMCSMKDIADARIAELEAQVTALEQRVAESYQPTPLEDIEF